MDDLIDLSIERTFHGVNYIITMNAAADGVCIEVEDKSTGDSWLSQYAANYIEDITSKTGNFKKYPVFLKMLLSALSNQTETVYVDILTFQDLEQLKNKRHKQNNAPTQIPASNKRYLILSYIVEFDKVHYPLPLNFNETPNLQHLKATITKLRKDNEQLTKTNQQFSQLVEAKKNDTTSNDMILEQNKEMDFLKSLLEQKERELLEIRNQQQQLVKRTDYTELRSRFAEQQNKLQATEQQNQDVCKKLIELEDYLSQVIDENALLKTQDKKHKIRITTLEQELQSALSRSTKKYQPIKSISNVSRSPSLQKLNRTKKNVPNKKSAEKTPIRQRKDSFDSDTESSFRRRSNMKPADSPSARSNSSRNSKQNINTNKLKSSNQKTQFQKPQIQQRTITKQAIDNTDEQRLLDKLKELRERNKENSVTVGSRIQQESESLQSIDDRLGRLTDMLKKVRHQD